MQMLESSVVVAEKVVSDALNQTKQIVDLADFQLAYIGGGSCLVDFT